MFKIESYITPILLSYVDKYVKDFKPADAQLSLWGGGVALHNLVLKADVLQQEVALPFTLVSGRIHELLIQVPWTKIMSEPIIVTIDTIECILNLQPPPDESSPSELPSSRVVEAPPGYMRALVRRVVSNISVRVHHLIVKYVQDDIVLSLNVKHLAVDSADSDWQPAFADIEASEPALRRLVRLDDLTLCLDRADADGKIRFYQEPLLYRCQLEFRVLTRLVSATRRRARALSVRVRAARLAGGASGDQLALLVRLLLERPPAAPPPAHHLAMPLPTPSSSSAALDGARAGSWTEWAWSWLPAWESAGGEEAAIGASPGGSPIPLAPLAVAAYFDSVSFAFKAMETETGGRRRARAILELEATHMAVTSSACLPTELRVRVGVRLLTLRALGKCVCGQASATSPGDEPPVYLSNVDNTDDSWTWPEDNFSRRDHEEAVAADEEFHASPDITETIDEAGCRQEARETGKSEEDLWTKMMPVVLFEYCHDRAPPQPPPGPCDKPPLDFEYSDWAEECRLQLRVRPLQLELCGGLLHRLAAATDLAAHAPLSRQPPREVPMRTLTVEECEALSDNLPQRRCSALLRGLRVRLWPWQHAPLRAVAPLLLSVELPLVEGTFAGPLYSYRVCSAACQMPEDEGVVWSGARTHVTLEVTGAHAGVCGVGGAPRPVGRASLRFAARSLLHPHLFKQRTTVHDSYTLHIREASVCGSVARLRAAGEVLASLVGARTSALLAHSTLAHDALHDHELVAVDATLEELSLRGFATSSLRTHIGSLHAARAVALHAPQGDTNVNQAWLFSGPEAPTTSPYVRVALQWSVEAEVEAARGASVEFAGAWLEPTALSLEPLLLAGLAYAPREAQPAAESQSTVGGTKTMSSSHYLMLRRTTPPSSSGRGGSRASSGAEVHSRPRSVASSSERSDRPPSRPHQPSRVDTSGERTSWWWSGERALRVHARLRRALACCELGLLQVYLPSQSVDAAGCACLRDAVERHAALRPVFALSVGHLSMHSNTLAKHLWNEIRHDGPTYLSAKPEQTLESFPWRVRVADVSCYTMHARTAAGGVARSTLRDTRAVAPRAILGMLTTTVTLSVVAKSLPAPAPPPAQRPRHPAHDEKVKYFTSGVDFKPSTLKEFIRGPAQHKKWSPETNTLPEMKTTAQSPPAPSVAGPLVSLGVHVHVDTPPVSLRLDREQVGVLAEVLHCLSHVAALLQRAPPPAPPGAAASLNKSFIRSVSEMESMSEGSPSENHSELIQIFEASATEVGETKTFVWLQWVVSRATLAVTVERLRLAADADDIIATVDLQPHYSQLKLKVASASLRHYRRSASDEWAAGAMGGRVLEAREPLDAQQDDHFLALTITQAQICNLPVSWREELHPKLLEYKSAMDSMWEVYATVAPLEAVLQASVVRHATAMLRLLRPHAAACAPPAPSRSQPHLMAHSSFARSAWRWPFVYLSAGGLRLLLTDEDGDTNAAQDDTLIFVIGKITVNPHPENPICRRAVSSCAEGGAWAAATSAPDGRQYEALARGVALRSARFQQLVRQEASECEMLRGTGGENPAFKWSQRTVSPAVTTLLHSVDVECVVAPAMLSGEADGEAPALVRGPALELNLAADCLVRAGLHHLALAAALAAAMRAALSPCASDADVDSEQEAACPYAPLAADAPPAALARDWRGGRSESLRAEPERGADSGVESAVSQSFAKRSFSDDPVGPIRKNVSIALVDHRVNPWEHLEVFVTMGLIEASLYAEDDGASELEAFRERDPPPPDHVPAPAAPAPAAATSAHTSPAAATAAASTPSDPQTRLNVGFEDNKERRDKKTRDGRTSAAGSTAGGHASAPDDGRPADIERGHLDLTNIHPHTKKSEGILQLIRLTLQQPNLYFWRKETQKTLQVSLFDAGAALGGGEAQRLLLSTERGARDPLTDIPPALATLRLSLPATSTTRGVSTSGIPNARGTLHLDVERPVLFDVCTDRVVRLHAIYRLVGERLWRDGEAVEGGENQSTTNSLRKLLTRQGLGSVSLGTGQVGVRGGAGTVGWSAASARLTAGSRPERLSARLLVRGLLAAVGAPGHCRRPLLLPANLGGTAEATWEAWRRGGGVSGALYADALTLDVRPGDLAALAALLDALQSLHRLLDSPSGGRSSGSVGAASVSPGGSQEDLTDHYYKDDLRSGAFKLVHGGQVPMAYQVRAAGGVLAWRYPHPRALTRLIAFPVPGLDEEAECVLELFESTLARWEPYAYFQLPASEPREVTLDATPADVVFALMWRVRLCPRVESVAPPFLFDANKFNVAQPESPCADAAWSAGVELETGGADGGAALSSEQLWGALRVDSYFAPRLLPPLRLALRLAALAIYLHNDLPRLPTEKRSSLEGFYVSPPLRRSHRVLALAARDVSAHARLGSPARRCLLHAHFSSDILDCTTGTMECFVEEFRAQGSASLATPVGVRMSAARVRASLHVPRLYTLHALLEDWARAYAQYIVRESAGNMCEGAAEVRRELRGRVSLWLHNACGAALRVSQQATDELLPLGAASMLAYRWRSPNESKKLRFSLANPSADWRWSSSIPFTEGTYRVRLEDTRTSAESEVERARAGAGAPPGAGVFVYARVTELGAARTMRLAGRLTLANMLRHSLLYKVRARCARAPQWQPVCSGELQAERVGPALLCDAAAELALKIKFTAHDAAGWSGDIPLKECPKENVPWLVKVPSGGGAAYVSVWCRVTRARSDGRLLAALWPLYVLHSHLPLDTQVVLTTESSDDGELPPPGPAQAAPGRGATTHLAAPGTTAARHRLTVQYTSSEWAATREAVPLHYGMTDTSVFDKCAPVHDVDDVLHEIDDWLRRHGREARSEWPYSLVRCHWHGTWQPALLQPRCDVSVRYGAVVAGGGCALAVQLCPAVLVANAAPVPLTLRAHDAAPLCRLEPGHALSPPSTLLTKPFFLSLDVGRETFVSEPLSVSADEPGRYGAPPPGQLALDHAAHLALHCNQEVALLTMFYEIRENINVLAVTSPYVLINDLDTDILVSLIAVPEGSREDVLLNPKCFTVIPPAKNKRQQVGEALCRASVCGRWRGGACARAFLCVSLTRAAGVPVRLAPPPARPSPPAPPTRRAIALHDQDGRSVAAVVTQQQHGGRWQVVVASDPCPQFIVYNRTRERLVIAQPERPVQNDPAAPAAPTALKAASECEGAVWWRTVAAGGSAHYSTPAHCARYPPGAPPRPSSGLLHHPTALTFLTFARALEDYQRPVWCVAVAVADGEQLVQLMGGATIKVRVRTAPHSTLIELQDVEQHDISASDIRRRLEGSSSSVMLRDHRYREGRPRTQVAELTRVGAADNLLTVSKCRLRIDTMSSDGHFVIRDDSKSRPSEASDPIPLESSVDGRVTEAWAHGAERDFISDDSRAPSLSGLEREGTRSVLAASGEFSSSQACVAQPEYGGEQVPGVDEGEERVRCDVRGLHVRLAAAADRAPLLALHLDDVRVTHRAARHADLHRGRGAVSVAALQLDNAQHASGRYDFAVVAKSCAPCPPAARWPPLWGPLAARAPPAATHRHALLLDVTTDAWTVAEQRFSEVTEVEVSAGPLALYVEDAFVRELTVLLREAWPAGERSAGAQAQALAAARSLQRPLRLRALTVHPLDLSLTLHTAVRMYIALDQSPLRLGAFRLRELTSSGERLVHALTVHYLSAALLGAGWVVGGLELVGAPGALAARVGGAGGGVRGVASATAAALLRSLSAAAGSLARNLDLLAGDDEHAQRAAAARRHPPPSLLGGLAAGLTNFAINMLGAVGGLAHHPVVGVCVGEAGGGAALRRGLVGALAKPLSATADLVAYAGHGLLAQTGWDTAPQARAWAGRGGGGVQAGDGAWAGRGGGGWHRDCVRWAFRLADATALAGFPVLLDDAPLLLIVTHKFLVVADPESERIVEMIDLKSCYVQPLEGHVVELVVKQQRASGAPHSGPAADDDQYQISAAAMARVARYTGAGAEGTGAAVAEEAGAGSGARTLQLRTTAAHAHALHAALAAAAHNNCAAHFPLL